MSLSANYRWIIVSNLTIRNEKTVPPHIPPFSFEACEAIIRDKFDKNNTHYLYQNGEKIMRIRSIGNANLPYLSLLISNGDKNAPEPSYENFDNDDIRDFEKQENEGLSLAAHVIIKKEPKNGKYLMMIERIAGFNITSIAQYLRHLFNDEDYMQEYEFEGSTFPYRPLFEITGYQSDTLRNALETGKLQDIEFIATETINDGFDEHGYVQEQVKSAKLLINRGIQTDTADNFFQNIINKFKTGNYQKMMVRIKTASGQIKQTAIDTDRDDVLSQYFIHNEVINDFNIPLSQTHKTINEEVVDKVLEKMDKHEPWLQN